MNAQIDRNFAVHKPSFEYLDEIQSIDLNENGVYVIFEDGIPFVKGWMAITVEIAECTDEDDEDGFSFDSFEVNALKQGTVYESENVAIGDGELISLTTKQIALINNFLYEFYREKFIKGAEDYAEDAQIERYIQKHEVY